MTNRFKRNIEKRLASRAKVVGFLLQIKPPERRSGLCCVNILLRVQFFVVVTR